MIPMETQANKFKQLEEVVNHVNSSCMVSWLDRNSRGGWVPVSPGQTTKPMSRSAGAIAVMRT
jgi:hypothetical protein